MPDRVDNDIGPECRSILADAPAFLFISAFAFRDSESLLGKLGVPVLLGIKSRKVLTYDFFLLVTLDPLRTGIPACDRSVAVKQIDRVVGYTIDEQPELLLAIA